MFNWAPKTNFEIKVFVPTITNVQYEIWWSTYELNYFFLLHLVVAGRYPDENFPGYVAGELRTIDIMNPGNGNMECQISQLGINKISSLNQYSNIQFKCNAMCIM